MARYSTAMKCLCAVTCIMIMAATVTSAAPSYADYDSKLIICLVLVTWKKRMGGPANEIAQYLLNRRTIVRMQFM